MNKKLTASTNETYFVTLTVINWIDIFTRPIYKNLLIDNMEYCRKEKGLEIYSYVIMTNHIHMIACGKEKPLGDILRDFKTYTSKELFKEIKNNPKESRKDWLIGLLNKAGKKNVLNVNHQFWQNYNQPIAVRNNKTFFVKQNYIHQNPVRAGIVVNDYEYLYSSASEQSPLKIDEY